MNIGRKFEVSAQWMKACGRGNAPKVFTVLASETNMVGARGMDCLLTLDDTKTLSNGVVFHDTWKVFHGRGRFVE